MIVFRGLYDGKKNNEIAREMGISTHRIKEHIHAIARKCDVRDYNNGALLVRCYCAWQEHLKHQTANPSPQLGTPLKTTLRKRPPRK